MRAIKVWCKYNIGGNFGGDNNEEVFLVSDGADIKELVGKFIESQTGEFLGDLEGSWDWEFMNIKVLN